MKALKIVLKRSGALPAGSIIEFKRCLDGISLLIVDDTEQCKNRLKNIEKQKDYYSGKKYHSVKYLCASDKRTRILYISMHHPGKIHDKMILEEGSGNEKLPGG